MTPAPKDAQLHETPLPATRALCRADPWLRQRERVIWEPACGPGAIVQALQALGHHVKAGDKYDYSDRWRGRKGQRVAWGKDFLSLSPREIPKHDAIVMNPPYSGGMADAFMAKAFDVSPRVYALLELDWIQGGEVARARDQLMDSPYWLAFYPFRERLNEMNRDGWTGRITPHKKRHAWFVFGREGRADGPYTRRISIKEFQHG
ncbi:class I SAM-dependent methyltransferase [Hyphomonas pacifica]|uniref:Methyltransferase small domain-containing protein n=1 Tax=Hyphomonas pacifica TaxID=1280941 RepID=A0A8B2PFY3_9PROT|nr:class I SAM-dependent methyltransferase [Hyphomonas pacifica]RAN30654.1 hypothetical protein HY3_05750 [Hyphomonas pacifica]